MKNKFPLFVGALLVLLSSCSPRVRFISWNMEHLAENVGVTLKF